MDRLRFTKSCIIFGLRNNLLDLNFDLVQLILGSDLAGQNHKQTLDIMSKQLVNVGLPWLWHFNIFYWLRIWENLDFLIVVATFFTYKWAFTFYKLELFCAICILYLLLQFGYLLGHVIGMIIWIFLVIEIVHPIWQQKF